MAIFARLRDSEDGEATVECIYNREIEAPVDDSLLFIVMGEEVNKKFDIDYDSGEMLIYNPDFEPDYSCLWVAQTIDFEFVEIEGI